MNCIHRRIVPAVLLLGPVLTFAAPIQAQNSVTASARPAISVLDSTKEQDGLVGSVRRVKTETARIELKDGQPVEGPPKLVEVTTYSLKGNRIENTSYPIGGSLVGKEEYKYDERGNITEMTLRDDRGAIVSRESYTYEFDKFGNWTRMVTSLVLFENGQLKREPVEVTYRTVTYYFDDNIAKAVEQPIAEPIHEIRVSPVPEPAKTQIEQIEVLNVELTAGSGSVGSVGEPPAAPNLKPIIAGPVITDQKRANDLYLAGRGQFDAGDVRGAVASYLQSIKLEPGSAEVFLNLGHAYLKLEKDGDAIKAFKESVKLNPDVAEAYYGLGFSNFRTHRFKDAADAFKKATTLNPQMAKAHYGLSLAYQELGNQKGLLDEYRILERLDSNLAKKLAATFPEYNFPCRRGGAGCQ
ncbi:MAG TPA: tetratricopeptide repeat protein [Pyrinomonadaceae bacterium]|nr:tetratricopeptide repeat protein [Pyrinomonadaceae bacterium]